MADPALTPRRAALAVLGNILEKGTPLQEALTEPAFTALPPRDRDLAHGLVLAVLRHRGWIDGFLGILLEKQPVPSVRYVLQMGLAQLFYLRIPGYAAVATSVALVPRGFAGLVNAVLRRAQREAGTLRPAVETPERLLPPMLWQNLLQTDGAEQATRIALKLLDTPPLDLTPLRGAMPVDFPGKHLPTGNYRLDRPGRVEALPGYGEGLWQVQDAAASLPARLFGMPLDGKTVLDLCAAPGGKTAQLAAQGAQVVAVDSSKRRLRRLAENLQRVQLVAGTVAADLRKWEPEQPVEAVLLDAPCTASGTFRRHPDVLWQKTESDLDSLTTLQGQLLERAAGWLAPGSRLVYCVCSLLEAEGEMQINRLLATRPDLRRLPFTAADLDGIGDFVTQQGDIRTTPAADMDGFFIARLYRQ